MKTFKEFLNESSHRPKWKKVNDDWHTTPITTFKDTMDAIDNKQPKKSELHYVRARQEPHKLAKRY